MNYSCWMNISNNYGSLSTGVDEVIFRIQFICELGSFFDFDFELNLNSINKVLPVLVTIRSSFDLLDFTVHTFCEIIWYPSVVIFFMSCTRVWFKACTAIWTRWRLSTISLACGKSVRRAGWYWELKSMTTRVTRSRWRLE